MIDPYAIDVIEMELKYWGLERNKGTLRQMNVWVVWMNEMKTIVIDGIGM